MSALRIFVASSLCAVVTGCTIDGQPMIQPVTAQDPPAEVHMAAPAIAMEQGPQSF
ncbi:MAG: hypothetical protein ACKOAL_11285 [Chthoniobacterales bacterium]